MKKLSIAAAALLAIAGAASAQNLEGTKLTDNISFTLKGGVATPLHRPRGDWGGNIRGGPSGGN
ncbi:MAG: hypothetical protein K2H33_06905, partial [Muribaculaceae bacterium]|nr:hypothetical protein [Muribaculaceae bacterium]